MGRNGRDEEERDQRSEVGGQKTDERGCKVGLNRFSDFNGLNEFAGGERLNGLNDLNSGPLTTDILFLLFVMNSK